MSMLSESLTIGLLLILVFGSLFFYLYSRVSYVEKRVGLIENILIDIRMNQEQQPINILPPMPPSMNFNNAAQLEIVPESSTESATESLPIENIEELYSETLNNAHASSETPSETSSELLSETPSDTPSDTPSVNYESMTKEELIEVAKQKGIRVSNRPGREKLIQIIRNSVQINNMLQPVSEE
jgi:hypothetical protein